MISLVDPVVNTALPTGHCYCWAPVIDQYLMPAARFPEATPPPHATDDGTHRWTDKHPSIIQTLFCYVRHTGSNNNEPTMLKPQQMFGNKIMHNLKKVINMQLYTHTIILTCLDVP